MITATQLSIIIVNVTKHKDSPKDHHTTLQAQERRQHSQPHLTQVLSSMANQKQPKKMLA